MKWIVNLEWEKVIILRFCIITAASSLDLMVLEVTEMKILWRKLIS